MSVSESEDSSSEPDPASSLSPSRFLAASLTRAVWKSREDFFRRSSSLENSHQCSSRHLNLSRSHDNLTLWLILTLITSGLRLYLMRYLSRISTIRIMDLILLSDYVWEFPDADPELSNGDGCVWPGHARWCFIELWHTSPESSSSSDTLRKEKKHSRILMLRSYDDSE